MDANFQIKHYGKKIKHQTFFFSDYFRGIMLNNEN